jgi:hypothetical protein
MCKLLSLLIPSRRPHQFSGLFDSIEKFTHDLSSIEVLIKVDDDQPEAANVIEKEIKKRPFSIKYISTPRLGGLFTLWDPENDLFKISDPDGYFLIVSTDELRFITPNWDDVLRKYVGFFPDHLFRLRISICKHRNYENNYACTIMPESFAVFTRTWLQVTEGMGDCWGTDAYHQCIAFHLGLGLKSYNDVWHNGGLWRDVQVHDLEFGGLEFGLDVAKQEQQARNVRMVREWRRLTTNSMQRHFTYLARRAYLYAWAHEHGVNSFTIAKRGFDRTAALYDADSGEELLRVSYRPPRLPVYFQNIKRELILLPWGIRRIFRESWGDLHFGGLLGRSVLTEDQLAGYAIGNKPPLITRIRYNFPGWVRRAVAYCLPVAYSFPVAYNSLIFFRIFHLVIDTLLWPLDRLTRIRPPGLENMGGINPIGMASRFRKTGYVIPAIDRVRQSYEKMIRQTAKLRNRVFAGPKDETEIKE